MPCLIVLHPGFDCNNIGSKPTKDESWKKNKSKCNLPAYVDSPLHLYIKSKYVVMTQKQRQGLA